jgi:hypothetical protein
METPTLIILGLQLLGLGFFIFLIYPWVKQENWKEKFWDNPNARALVIVFGLIAVFIVLFKLLMFFLTPVELLK